MNKLFTCQLIYGAENIEVVETKPKKYVKWKEYFEYSLEEVSRGDVIEVQEIQYDEWSDLYHFVIDGIIVPNISEEFFKEVTEKEYIKFKQKEQAELEMTEEEYKLKQAQEELENE